MIFYLILYSPSPEYDAMMLSQRAVLQAAAARYWFYCFRSDLDTDWRLDGDILYLRGHESLVPGCLDKTLRAMKLALDHFPALDHLVRLNISTLCAPTLLARVLASHIIHYAAGHVFQLNWLDPASGIVDERYFGRTFGAGTSIILSRAACRQLFYLVPNFMHLVDDVAIGFALDNCQSLEGLGHPYRINSDDLAPATLFYRNKRDNRLDDVRAMSMIATQLVDRMRAMAAPDTRLPLFKYGAEDADIVYADMPPQVDHAFLVPVPTGARPRYTNVAYLQWSASFRYACYEPRDSPLVIEPRAPITAQGATLRVCYGPTDITRIAVAFFRRGDQLHIPADTVFNDAFGDTCYAMHKWLAIRLHEHLWIQLPEIRGESIEIHLVT